MNAYIRPRVAGKIVTAEPKPEPTPLQQLDKAICDEALRPYTFADLQAADAAVSQARADFRQAGINVQRARTEQARALTQWNAGAPTISWEENAAQFRASESAERQRRAELTGSGVPYHPNVSQMAKAFSGGGHNTRRGGGRAYARGALSKAQAMEANALRIRAERAALPAILKK